MPRVIEEYVYPAMEDFMVDFVLDKGPYAEAVRIPVKPFTLVGATTRKGLLSSPLRERFGLNFELDFYAVDDLTLIVRRSAGLLERAARRRSPPRRSRAARAARRGSPIACCGGYATSPRCTESTRRARHWSTRRSNWKALTCWAWTIWIGAICER